MNPTISDNKRIARNTLLLYFRMILTMLVSLYTSRIVLNTLGVVDFGINNVVGGVVVMFSFFNTAMSSSTQRFLSFELGVGSIKSIREVFSMSINVHLLIAILVLLLSETVGLWFLKTYIVIPEDRVGAAYWVYQCAVLSFAFTVIGVPYNASIIAYEKMSIFAYFSIFEVFLKLIIVFVLRYVTVDKLKLYSVLLLCITIITRLLYAIYCRLRLKGCQYVKVKNFELFKSLLSYAGWSLSENISIVSVNQGINFLLNIGFGPIINASRAIAIQVSSAVRFFVSNFQVAVNPQIVKRYAENEMMSMFELVFISSKLSYFVFFLIGLPICVEVERILILWLGVVPDYTVSFIRYVIIAQLIDTLSGSIVMAVQASGKIKMMQSIVGGVLLLVLPLSYYLIKLSNNPNIPFVVMVVFSIILLVVKLYISKKVIGLSVFSYYNEVLVPVIKFSLPSLLLPLYLVFYNFDSIFFRLFLIILSLFLAILFFSVFGLNKQQRVKIFNFIKNYKL